MAYATQADLVPLRITQNELLQLTCDDTPLNIESVVNAAVVTSVLEEASGTVDSYCRARYVTPLQPSDMVTARTLDLAVYLLFSRRRGGLQPKEIVRQRYEDAIQFLKDVASAKASLDQPASQQTPQTSAAGPQISRKDRELVFREDNIGGFV